MKIWSVYRQEHIDPTMATDEELAALPREERDRAIKEREQHRARMAAAYEQQTD